jgi:amino acid permease
MLGGDQRLADLRVVLIESSGTGSMFPNQNHDPKSGLSIAFASILLLKAVLATDPFFMVSHFESGAIQCFVIALLLLFLTHGSYAIYVRSWAFDQAYTLSGLWRLTVGPGTAWFVHVLTLYAYLTCLISEYWEIVDGVGLLITHFWPTAPSILFNVWFLQYVTLACVLSPILLRRTFRAYLTVAGIGVFGALLGLTAAAIYLFRHMFDDGKYIAASQVVLFQPNVQSIAASIRDFTAALFGHPFLPYIAQEMHEPSRDRVMTLTWVSNITATLLIYLIPFVGYLLFSGVAPDFVFFHSLDPEGAPEVIIGRIAVLIVTITSNVFFTFFSGEAFASSFRGEAFGTVESRSKAAAPQFLGALALSLFAICANFLPEWILAVLYDLASAAYSILGLIFPAVIYLARFRFKVFRWGLMSVILFCLGGFLVVILFVGMFQRTLSEGEG